MKTIIKRFTSFCLLSLLLITSCKDEKLSPYLEPEAAAHGFGELVNGAFDSANMSASSVDVTVQWISIDKKVEISEIVLFVHFFEEYVDKDGNPAVAVHGSQTAPNLVLTGLANRTPGTVKISAEQVYQLFKDVTFKYDGANAVPVFDNPEKPRPAENRFLEGDSFSVTWSLKGKNGLVYKSWSPSVCTELLGANCEVAWEVE
jgi:hypothetical protein